MGPLRGGLARIFAPSRDRSRQVYRVVVVQGYSMGRWRVASHPTRDQNQKYRHGACRGPVAAGSRCVQAGDDLSFGLSRSRARLGKSWG